jgi:hypothetical protein
MLRATHLGWQGWLIACESHTLLLDPVLVDEIGRGPAHTRIRTPFYLPRQWQGAFPAVDAIVLSHEHEDHFSIPTLAGIDRRVPVFLSARSSSAARTILSEMGFEVLSLAPGSDVDVGPLRVRALSPALSSRPDWDEWDTLAIHVSHAERCGNFFTNVDVAITSEMREFIASLGANGSSRDIPTVAFTAPSLSLWGKQGPGSLGPDEDPSPFVASALSFQEAEHRLLKGGAVKPFPGFSVALDPHQPLQVFGSDFLEVPPPAHWPAPTAIAVGSDALPPPCCGRRQLSASDFVELEAGLGRIAEWIYGGHVFRRLCSLPAVPPDRKGTFVLILLAGEQADRHAYEYDPGGCRFARVDASETAKYMGRVFWWASDLLALLRGEVEPRPITAVGRESWNPAMGGLNFSRHVAWPFFHPLRHPDTCLLQYREAYALAQAAPLRVPVRFNGAAARRALQVVNA